MYKTAVFLGNYSITIHWCQLQFASAINLRNILVTIGVLMLVDVLKPCRIYWYRFFLYMKCKMIFRKFNNPLETFLLLSILFCPLFFVIFSEFKNLHRGLFNGYKTFIKTFPISSIGFRQIHERQELGTKEHVLTKFDIRLQVLQI